MNIFDPLPRYLRIVGGDGNADQSEQSGSECDLHAVNHDEHDAWEFREYARERV